MIIANIIVKLEKIILIIFLFHLKALQKIPVVKIVLLFVR